MQEGHHVPPKFASNSALPKNHGYVHNWRNEAEAKWRAKNQEKHGITKFADLTPEEFKLMCKCAGIRTLFNPLPLLTRPASESCCDRYGPAPDEGEAPEKGALRAQQLHGVLD